MDSDINVKTPFEKLLDELELTDPGMRERMEARRIEKLKCSFEGMLDNGSRFSYFTKGWKSVPYAWLVMRGKTLSRKEFAAARRRDSIKRRRHRRITRSHHK